MRTNAGLALCLCAGLQGCIIATIAKVGGTVDAVTRSGQRGDTFTVPGYQARAPVERPAAAGAGIADITPPPGFPTGGHGPAGEVARGYWVRLKARAFFFEDGDGRALALVSCDLFAVPSGLQAQVAQMVNAELTREGIDVSLPPEALILAATHTHHGPGNYLTARVYNQFGYSFPGFSVALFKFLAKRITRAVMEAIRVARSHPGAVELVLHEGTVGYDVLRNRSPATFGLNRNRKELLEDLKAGSPAPICKAGKEEPQDGWDIEGCPRLGAVDRRLTVVELVRTEGGHRIRVGALVFFAAHPTDLKAETPFYSPDFTGVAMTALERRYSTRNKMVFGFFNGAEGDVTLRRGRRDLLEALKFGKTFENQIASVLESGKGHSIGPISIDVRSGNFRPADAVEGRCIDAQHDARLAPAPKLGTAALGGAEDDRTILYGLGWRDGVRDKAFDGQGVKLPALDSRLLRGLRLSDEFAPPEAFPATITLVVASLGHLVLLAVPAELSTAEGQAVLKSATPKRAARIIGLANDYVSYVASRDEYWSQDYMSASTLWGPEEGPFLECQLQQLVEASARNASPSREAGTAKGEPGPIRPAPDRMFLPGVEPEPAFGREFSGEVERPDDGLGESLLNEGGIPERHLPWFAWSGSAATEFDQTGLREVAIWIQSGSGWREYRWDGAAIEDDSGDRFLTVHLGKNRWAAIWLRPLTDQITGSFAFVVREDKSVYCSVPFPLSEKQTAPDPMGPADGCAEFVRSAGGQASSRGGTTMSSTVSGTSP